MKIDKLVHTLQAKLDVVSIKLDDVDSVLDFLYNAYYDQNRKDDNDEIKQAFEDLYATMNGKKVREMDEIIYPVCSLCRAHQQSGFTDGLKLGFLFFHEMKEE